MAIFLARTRWFHFSRIGIFRCVAQQVCPQGMSFDAKFPWLSNKSKVNADGAAPDPSGSIEVDMLDPVAYIPVKQIDSFFPFMHLIF